MTKYVRNPDGGVHSVPDEFELPDGTWEELTEDEARDAHPSLFGETDQQVAATELHDGSTDEKVRESDVPSTPIDQPAYAGATPDAEGTE